MKVDAFLTLGTKLVPTPWGPTYERAAWSDVVRWIRAQVVVLDSNGNELIRARLADCIQVDGSLVTPGAERSGTAARARIELGDGTVVDMWSAL